MLLSNYHQACALFSQTIKNSAIIPNILFALGIVTLIGMQMRASLRVLASRFMLKGKVSRMGRTLTSHQALSSHAQRTGCIAFDAPMAGQNV